MHTFKKTASRMSVLLTATLILVLAGCGGQVDLKLTLKPGDTHARRVMGLALAQKGDAKRAIKELEAAVRSDTRDVNSRLVLGQLLAGAGNILPSVSLGLRRRLSSSAVRCTHDTVQ